MIVWVNVVLNRTVVVDSDCCFNNLCGSHLQSQSELYHVSSWYYTLVIDLAPVVRKVDSAIHWINYYPKDSAIGFRNTYPLDSDLSGG